MEMGRKECYGMIIRRMKRVLGWEVNRLRMDNYFKEHVGNISNDLMINELFKNKIFPNGDRQGFVL